MIHTHNGYNSQIFRSYLTLQSPILGTHYLMSPYGESRCTSWCVRMAVPYKDDQADRCWQWL